MAHAQTFLLKQGTAGTGSPYLLKLDREAGKLNIFRQCPGEALFDFFPIKKGYDFNRYVIFEKYLSFCCIFGGQKSPTPAGLFYIEAKSAEEYISPYYPGYDRVKFFGYLAVFEDYFIHSDLYAEDEVVPVADRAISRNDKTTSGCIRVSQKDLSWLIENIDIGTIVLL